MEATPLVHRHTAANLSDLSPRAVDNAPERPVDVASPDVVIWGMIVPMPPTAGG